jgi:hypothetical protein
VAISIWWPSGNLIESFDEVEHAVLAGRDVAAEKRHVSDHRERPAAAPSWAFKSDRPRDNGLGAA